MDPVELRVRGLASDRTQLERRGDDPRSPGFSLPPPGLVTEGMLDQLVVGRCRQRAAGAMPPRSRKHHARGSHTRAAAARGRRRGRGAWALLICCQNVSGGRRGRDEGLSCCS